MAGTERATAALIHGSPGNGQAWKAVAERLAPHFRVLTPTLPGHEAAAAVPPRRVETSDLAVALENELRGVDGPIVLAAHSFGGNVALQLALSERLPVARMILFEPVAMAALRAAGADAAYAAAESVFSPYVQAVESGDRGAVARMIDFWFGEGAFAAMPPRVQDYLRAAAPVNARDVAATFRERYAAADLGRIDVPVRVIHGAKSPPTAAQIARALAACLPRCEVQELPGADHAMLTTHPEQIAALIAAA